MSDEEIHELEKLAIAGKPGAYEKLVTALAVAGKIAQLGRPAGARQEALAPLRERAEHFLRDHDGRPGPDELLAFLDVESKPWLYADRGLTVGYDLDHELYDEEVVEPGWEEVVLFRDACAFQSPAGGSKRRPLHTNMVGRGGGLPRGQHKYVFGLSLQAWEREQNEDHFPVEWGFGYSVYAEWFIRSGELRCFYRFYSDDSLLAPRRENFSVAQRLIAGPFEIMELESFWVRVVIPSHRRTVERIRVTIHGPMLQALTG